MKYARVWNADPLMVEVVAPFCRPTELLVETIRQVNPWYFMVGLVDFFNRPTWNEFNLWCLFFVFYSGAKMELVPTIALVQGLMVGSAHVLLVYLHMFYGFFLDVEIAYCRSSLNKSVNFLFRNLFIWWRTRHFLFRYDIEKTMGLLWYRLLEVLSILWVDPVQWRK